MSATGLVVVDKEAGWTSHDVVARCRRLFGQRRVGHAGTLDPDATGPAPGRPRPGHPAAAVPDRAPQDLRGRDRAGHGHHHPRRLGGGRRDLGHVRVTPAQVRAAAAGLTGRSSRSRRWSRRSRSGADACTSWPGRGSRWSGRPARSPSTASTWSRSPTRPGRVPGRGGVLVGDLRPRAGRRPGDGARRRGPPAAPAAHRDRVLRRGRDATARADRPRRRAHPGRGHAATSTS